MPDLIGGQVQAMFGVMPASLGYIRSGKLRALAVTTATRQEVLPDVPAMAEFLPGYEASGWYGVVAPKGTPPEIVDMLNRADQRRARRSGDARPASAALGCGVFAGSPADFGKFIADETAKWAKVVKFANIKAD